MMSRKTPVSGRVKILDIQMDSMTKEEALNAIEARLWNREISYVVFVNVDVVIKADGDQKLKQILNRADLAFADGMPVIWTSRLFGMPLKERVAGSDLVPQLCARAAMAGWRIFFLGGASGVPEKAAENLRKKFPDIQICGTYSPPLGFENDKKELQYIEKTIKDKSPELLIVCLGCPKQEKFVYDYYRNCGAAVTICAGATVDFLAGNVRRCPKWLGSLGFEWFFRFLMEPRRLFKRYFIDDMRIFRLIWKYRPRQERRG
ncbi:WecB/TagA/CpsF family glycosyltransferase [Clostridium sp. M62/1]|uniref:WecB/TagA/CpsF family glycosyltransferase n=1 Tax=Clostridium sp. M62/1 TaxID=411486 RepID=UPI0002D60FC0|nr:WecB/TagA/CpsF family glycosyltransferase [Clostridium sp. M62/1]UEB77418.1 WecB/TagA/CpsF family glycosyltransferase [Clostridium sp. M62/1]